MSSPIIFLIIWAVFNILIKSSRDKKKAEEAKRRRAGQGTEARKDTNVHQRDNKSQKKNFRQTIQEYRDQIEKEFAMETQTKQKPIQKQAPIQKEAPKKKQASFEEKNKTFREGRFWKIEEEKPEEPVTLIEETEIGDEVFFEIRKDILKGVIYSEILNKPKSLQ